MEAGAKLYFYKSNLGLRQRCVVPLYLGSSSTSPSSLQRGELGVCSMGACTAAGRLYLSVDQPQKRERGALLQCMHACTPMLALRTAPEIWRWRLGRRRYT